MRVKSVLKQCFLQQGIVCSELTLFSNPIISLSGNTALRVSCNQTIYLESIRLNKVLEVQGLFALNSITIDRSCLPVSKETSRSPKMSKLVCHTCGYLHSATLSCASGSHSPSTVYHQEYSPMPITPALYLIPQIPIKSFKNSAYVSDPTEELFSELKAFYIFLLLQHQHS